MERCQHCGRRITEDSRSYEKRLEACRAAIGDYSIVLCDTCIKGHYEAIKRQRIAEGMSKFKKHMGDV